ncbi:MAG: hypothetical protein K1X78_26025 [Verrucomicrobiaceae bacterium]|nr:hypothetical protein [Verrucomicrobiaceae bacterium]
MPGEPLANGSKFCFDPVMPAPDERFPATRWSLIPRIRGADEADARRALNDLFSQYHYPLYCFIRRRGLEHHDAQDALHDFFCKLLRNESLNDLEAGDGRLRGYLCTALQRFLANWHRDHARERLHDSIEAAREASEAEDRFQREKLTDADTPERIFERKWAHELLRAVQDKLRARFCERGKEQLYDALLPGLMNGGSLRGEDTPRIAAALGMSEGSLRVAMTRLLDEYRTVLRAEVRQTVERDEDVEAELAHLLAAFRRQ